MDIIEELKSKAIQALWYNGSQVAESVYEYLGIAYDPIQPDDNLSNMLDFLNADDCINEEETIQKIKERCIID